jgi:UDP-N-acetylglucosamine transferase subunit ALG13
MIFVTVGSQMPFDRLIAAIDEWAGLRPCHTVFAQTAATSLRPRHMRTIPFMSPAEYSRALREANLIVGHAGMGTIISSFELGKQLVVMPRLGRLGETRNDHQVATAKHFAEQGRVIVASDETELAARLDYAVTLTGFAPPIEARASPRLLETIRAFLAESPISTVSLQPVMDDNSGFDPVSVRVRSDVEIALRRPQRTA